MAGTYRDPFESDGSFTEQLRGKSRGRREHNARLVRSSGSARTTRNDTLPSLELVRIPVDDLRPPARKVRKCDPAHVREVAASINALGFCDPLLIGNNNLVIDGEIRLEAAKLLGLVAVPCIRVGHLTDAEQRTLRLALNRLGEKGQWDVAELKIEFEELILTEAPVEISGFSLDEIDQIVLDDDQQGVEQGPLAPDRDALAVSRHGDVFRLGLHRVICGDATDAAVLSQLMNGDTSARLILTDEPYNVRITGHVTSGTHRDFGMASGEMTDAEFLAFNLDWMGAALAFLCDGGVFGTFIDWRGYSIVSAAASKLGLLPLNLVVWTKTNAGMGSLYRSQHELLPLYKKGRRLACQQR